MIDTLVVNEKFIINKYLGWQYKHRGREEGYVDCYGLIIHIYRDLGIKLWDIEEQYDKNWSFKGKNYFIENYYRQWVKVANPNVFDVVLFGKSQLAVNHGGVILSNGRFIHTCRAGTVISRLGNFQWWKRIQGFYKFKKP